MLPRPQGGSVAERRLRIAHERGRSEVGRMPSARDGTHFNRPGLPRFTGGAGARGRGAGAMEKSVCHSRTLAVEAADMKATEGDGRRGYGSSNWLRPYGP